MSSSTQFSPVIQQLHSRKSTPYSISILKVPRLLLLPPISLNCSRIHLNFKVKAQVLENHHEGGIDDSPASVELQPISGESQFDRIIADAQQVDESVVILWMANWCRKCIYLKPKLEKLAADYFPRTRFYSVDVNNVPHKLVVRAGVTKMPTVQLWRDGKKQAEVIGGNKAYLVVSEVRDMIENEDNL
ncbi:thioredoxin-like 3-2, chloroplastic isoform X1 [Capsicum annuum]|uniref:thioredoxin-like 3-2, chloroplastic isoform X1 n=1 Tax=Capsicum annuum TaxID=4072 RepID=UPI001FB0E4E1|nr:thioredoxin-like 3-2, chloroplastic isoform X1 [Capsicum annuum]